MTSKPATARYTLPVAVSLLLVKDDKILLSRRHNTGWEDGRYGFIAGHIDGDESLTAALCREAYEEAGITIKPEDAVYVHSTHHKSNREYMYIFFEVKKWLGEPSIKEPDKCDALEWYPLDALPDNLVFGTKAVLEAYQRGVMYSEVGW